MHSLNFETYVPLSSISKSNANKETGNYIVSGIASNGDRDLQGEIICPEGLDISYLLSSGYIDYEHDKGSVIGVPIEDGTYVDSDGLHLKALIFGDDPRVQKMFKLQQQFDDNNVNRSLGFSIEGKVLDRDVTDESIVREVMVSGVALTYRPACDTARVKSWSKIVKSVSENTSLAEVKKSLDTDAPLENINKGGAWEAGSGVSPKTQHGGAAMRTESLEGSITTLAEKIKKLEEQGVKANEMADKLAEELSGGKYSATIKQVFLQLYSGISGNGAKKLVNQSFNESDFQRAFNSNDADGQVDNDNDDDDND